MLLLVKIWENLVVTNRPVLADVYTTNKQKILDYWSISVSVKFDIPVPILTKINHLIYFCNIHAVSDHYFFTLVSELMLDCVCNRALAVKHDFITILKQND